MGFGTRGEHAARIRSGAGMRVGIVSGPNPLSCLWVDGSIYIDGWMDEWMDGWMDGWIVQFDVGMIPYTREICLIRRRLLS